MKERKKLSQKRELCTKGKVHLMIFLDEENVDIIDFWEEKEVFLNGGTWKNDLS